MKLELGGFVSAFFDKKVIFLTEKKKSIFIEATHLSFYSKAKNRFFIYLFFAFE